MRERFFSQGFKEVGVEPVKLYTAPEDMNTGLLTGLFISNVTDRNSWVEVWLLKKDQNDLKVQLTSSETPLPAGSTAAIAALGQRIQLKPGDTVWVKMRHEKAADVMISVSEVIMDDFDLGRGDELLNRIVGGAKDGKA